MKSILLVLCVTLILVQTAQGEIAPTLSFDVGLVRIEHARTTARYGSFEPILIGQEVTLASTTCLIELAPDESIRSMQVVAMGKEHIAKFEVSDAYDDVPTCDDTDRYRHILSSARVERLGSKPFQAIDEVTVGGKRYIRSLVFPITVDADGNCFFHRTVSVLVGARVITAAQLLFPHELAECHCERRLHSPASTPGGIVEYLIVTSSLLAEPFERLAAYKRSTGITTQVKLITDILPCYDGRDDAEKLRRFLKEFHTEGGRYVLLAGDETQLPIRYAYHNSAYSVPGLDRQQVCDLYFADLTGDWNADNDSVWGEKYGDQPDLTPELYVGRLPFNTVREASNYVDKLVSYETNPGDNGRAYLDKAFFFSSDQMRDYGDAGQHGLIALAYPDHFRVDTANGIELARGDDPNPYNLPSAELEQVLSEGYGIVNIIAHGSSSTFAVRTSGYNDWPKSYFTTDTVGYGHGVVSNLAPNGKCSFYYSLACDNGAFDMDQPPFNGTNPNLVQTLLGLKNAGAVAFVAYSRWGWVSSSHLLQKAFFDSLFAHPDRPAIDAMYASKDVYYYYRDLVYGQIFYGDPTLRIYTGIPGSLSVSMSPEEGNIVAQVQSGLNPVTDCEVIISHEGDILGRYRTDGDGAATIYHDLSPGESYIVAAVKAGYSIGRAVFTPSIIADVSNEEYLLPEQFILRQNYPNPFNPATTIAFDLARRSTVRLAVHNVLGQTLSVLKDNVMPAGCYSLEWDSTDLSGNQVASGVYFYRLEADGFTATKKMLLVR